jgi:hypothetical protein
MNERFEQMMLEATKDMPQGYYVPGEYFQKFAELIVRECAVICDAYGMPDGTSEVAQILSTAIKSKFGLE